MRRLPPKVLLPLFLLLGAQSPPGEEGCADYARETVYAPFVTLLAIEAGRPVAIGPGAVLAHEIVQYHHPSWRTPAAIRLPGPDALLYPAGTPVTMAFVNFGDLRPCLPSPPETDRRVGRTRLLLCLVDGDGDGRYEAVERLGSVVGAHVPMISDRGTVPLPAPLRLVDDPRGDPMFRNHAHRRLVVTALDGDDATFVVRDTIHELQEVRTPGEAGVFEPGPDGSRIYRSPPPDPAIPEPGRGDHVSGRGGRIVRLADGALVELAGLHLAIARAGTGWTATPREPRFAPWIARQCGGRRLRIGAPG
jgi:hypothetical protein